jgi:hypothetical protein
LIALHELSLGEATFFVWFGVWSLTQGQLPPTTNLGQCLIQAEPDRTSLHFRGRGEEGRFHSSKWWANIAW